MLPPSSHWPLAGKSCVQLPMHRQRRVQGKLHSNSERFLRHVNFQKTLSEAQTSISNQCPRRVDEWAEPGKLQETSFKTWPNREPINWHHQVKICFSQTSFVTPPPAPDSVTSIGIVAEDMPAHGRGVGTRHSLSVPCNLNHSVILWLYVMWYSGYFSHCFLIADGCESEAEKSILKVFLFWYRVLVFY